MKYTPDPSHIPLVRCADLTIISDTPKGRGVFATKLIPAKTVIDVCPVLVLGIEENTVHVAQTSLYHYTYNWPVDDIGGKRNVAQAVILGLGSMFNHSTRDQNVVWERDTERLIITYRAHRDILAGEELCGSRLYLLYHLSLLINEIGISYGSHLTFQDTDNTDAEAQTEEDGLESLNQIQLD